VTVGVRRLLVTLGCTLVLAACAADDPSGTASDPSPGPTPPPGAAEATLVALDLLPSEAQAAITDAATRFDVPESEVAVAGALRVVWSDGSLGCPEDGMMYTQALIDGYRLTLEVKGQRIEYHGADGQPPSLCED
jgi:hypothetical protein